MFESSDDTKVRRPRRVEVFTGPERRRDWPDDRKIAIVAESLEPGVNASALARSHDINPQQLFGWRRRFRKDAEALIASSCRDPESVSFAPVHVDAPCPAFLRRWRRLGPATARSRSRSVGQRCAFAAQPTQRR
jgi:transposase